MIIINSSALIAILRLEPEANHFLRIIVSARSRLMSSLNLLETSMVLSGPRGEASSFLPLDDFIATAKIAIVPFDAEHVHYARIAFARFGKGRHPASLNLGDCTAYALAKARNAPLLFKGNDFSQTDVQDATAV